MTCHTNPAVRAAERHHCASPLHAHHHVRFIYIFLYLMMAAWVSECLCMYVFMLDCMMMREIT